MVANLNTAKIYHDTAVFYSGILTLENVGTAVNYCSIFITLVPDVNINFNKTFKTSTFPLPRPLRQAPIPVINQLFPL
jgi:hypothetical protein